MQKKKWSEAKFLSVVSMLILIFLIFSSLIFVLQKKSTSIEVKIPSFSGGATSATGTVRFCLDKSPSLTNPGNKNATENTLFTLTINYSDEDCSSLSFSDNSTLFNITSTGLINFTLDESGVRKELINITLSDAIFSVSTLFNITLNSYLQPNYTKFSDDDTSESNDYGSDYLSNFSRYTLSTSNAKITWLNPVNTIGQNFDQYINFSSGFISVDVAKLNVSFNNSAQISIENVTCPVDIYFVSYVSLSNADIVSNGTLCSSSTDPSCTNKICSGTTVTFNVSHFSSFGASSSSGGGGGVASSGGPIRRKTISTTPSPEKEVKISVTEEEQTAPTPTTSELEQPKQTISENKTTIQTQSIKITEYYDWLPIILLSVLFLSLIILSFILSRE